MVFAVVREASDAVNRSWNQLSMGSTLHQRQLDRASWSVKKLGRMAPRGTTPRRVASLGRWSATGWVPPASSTFAPAGAATARQAITAQARIFASDLVSECI